MQHDDAEHAIELLYDLLERSPADKLNRLRLLPLLHAAGRTNEFVLEAGRFQELCQPIDDETWAYICNMGRDLAPQSPLFQTVVGEDGQPDASEDDAATAAGESIGGEQVKEDRRKWERRQRYRRKTDGPPP